MSVAEKREFLDAAPLQALIRRDLEAAKRATSDAQRTTNGSEALAARTGIHARILLRILTQNQVTLRLADQYCTAAGHILSLVYPDIYNEDSDGFATTCKHCGEYSNHAVLREGHQRIHVQCPDCGRGHYVQRYSRRGLPANNRRRDIDEQLPRMISLYQNGHSLNTIGRILGANESIILTRLRDAGIPRRTRAHAIVGRDDARRKGSATRIQQGSETTRLVLELRASGHSYASAGRVLGISQTGARKAAERYYT